MQICKSLSTRYCRFSYIFRDINIKRIVTFRKYLNVTEYNFCNDTIRWQISDSTIFPHILLLDLTVSIIYIFFYFVTLKNSNRSRSTIFAMTPFDGRRQNIHDFTTFFRYILPFQTYKHFKRLDQYLQKTPVVHIVSHIKKLKLLTFKG